MLLKTSSPAWPSPEICTHNCFWKLHSVDPDIHKTPTEQVVDFSWETGGEGDQFQTRYSVSDISGRSPDLLGVTGISSITLFFFSLFFKFLFFKSVLVTLGWKFNSFHKISSPVPRNKTTTWFPYKKRISGLKKIWGYTETAIFPFKGWQLTKKYRLLYCQSVWTHLECSNTF